MMRVKLLVVTLLSVSAAGLGGYLSTSPAGAGPQEQQVKEIAGYRQWARITPGPIPIDLPSLMG